MDNKRKNVNGYRPNLLWPYVLVLLLAVSSRCAVEQEFPGTSHIATTFRLTTPAAMEGKLTIAEAYLKLDRIEVSGSLSGKNNTSLTHPIPADEPPYRLTQADSSEATFSVSSRAFDQLDLHLFPFTDSYQLVYLDGTGETPPAEEPQQGGNEDSDTDSDGNEDQGTHDDDADNGNDDNDKGDGNNNDGSGVDNGGQGGSDGGDNGNESDDNKDKSDDDDGDKSGDDKENDKKDKDKDKDDKDKDDKKNKDEDGDKHDHKGNDHDHDDDGKDDDRDDGDKDDDDDDRDDRKSRNDANRVVDLGHFFQNARPGLVVFGVYENNGKTINLILAVTDVEKISVRARQSDSFSIMLTENNSAELSFDPAHWFESLTPTDIEGATTQMYQQQNVLFIHPDHNAALYQALVPRIEGSADLQIKAPGSENL